ncbi:MAG: GNAT family N-acetyltransferase [Methylomicrobium sp.]|nr:GNAT family N-acetyltransferase [Methylomicrobium sp.]
MKDGIKFAETEEEFQASYRLRYRVYVECMGRLKDKGDHVRKELRDDYDMTARSVIAIKNGEPVGTLRLFWGEDAPFSESLIEAYHLAPFLDLLTEDKICIIERLMVDEKHRGSATTLLMYREVMHFVLKQQIEVVLLDCEPHHLNSYLKLGFRPFAETYSYPGIGLVIPMALVSGDYEHLKCVGSPFAVLTREQDLDYCRHVDDLKDLINNHSRVISQTTASRTEFFQQIYSNENIQSNGKPKIFDSLSTDEIDRLVEKSHIIECVQGDHIIEKDNSAKTMFVLLSGLVEVQKDGKLLAIITPGEVVGEISFFLNIPRTASIIAMTSDVRLLSLNEAAMSRLLKYDGVLANKILQNLCRGLCCRVIGSTEADKLGIN